MLAGQDKIHNLLFIWQSMEVRIYPPSLGKTNYPPSLGDQPRYNIHDKNWQKSLAMLSRQYNQLKRGVWWHLYTIGQQLVPR